jgi:peptidoglycan/LPS O-acetylase OafA/YrhL
LSAHSAQASGKTDAAAPARADHFLALDLMRGLAALAVVIYHLGEMFEHRETLPGAFLAVDLFFLMSGLVVARSYEGRLSNGSMSFWNFASVRVVRLYPLYIVSVLIGAAYFAGKIMMHQPEAPSVSSLVAATPSALLVLPSTVRDFSGFPFSPAAWSLSFEIWFNFLYAVLVVRLGWRTLTVIALASFVLLVQQALAAGVVDLGWGIDNLLGGAARFWFSFTIGVLIWRITTKSTAPPLWTLRLVQALWPLAVVLGFGFVLVPGNAVVLQLVWIALVFPPLVYFVARARTKSVTATVSDHAGRLSYGLYILHGPVMLLAMGMMTALLGEGWKDNVLWAALLLLAVVVIATAILTYAFDEPARRYLRNLMRSRRTAAKPATQG